MKKWEQKTLIHLAMDYRRAKEMVEENRDKDERLFQYWLGRKQALYDVLKSFGYPLMD